jgi:hypothetical protein
MAKLSIDIGVNLGTATRDLGTLKMAFDNLSASVDNYSSKISALKTNLGQLKSTSVNVNVNQTGGPQIQQPKLTPVQNIFQDYISGAVSAASVTEFLKIREQELRQSIEQLNAIPSGQFTQGQAQELKKLEGELRETIRLYKLANNEIGKSGRSASGAAGGYTNLSAAQMAQMKTTNLANLSLINFGRVAQDLPFGILGIANNLNPLIEGFKQLSDAAKVSGNSVGKELLKSLTSFGGLTVAVSAVSAALSFASVGLSYWTRGFKENKKEVDESTKKLKEQEEQLKSLASELASEAVKVNGLVNAYKEGDRPLKERKAILNELKNIAPEYFNNLSAEKSSIDDLTLAYDKFNKNLQQNLQNRVIAKQAEDVITKILQLEARQADVLKNKKVQLVDKEQLQNINEYQQFQRGTLGLTKDEVKELDTLKKQRDDLLAQIKDTASALRGVNKEQSKNTKDQDTFAKAVAEIKDDVDIINRNPLTPFDIKQQQIAARIQEGLKYLQDNKDFKVDLEADLKLSDSKFKKLQETLSAAQIRLFTAQAEDDYKQFLTKLQSISKTADILGTNRLEAQINETTGEIARLAEATRVFEQIKPFGDSQITAFNSALALSNSITSELLAKLTSLKDQKLSEDLKKVWDSYNQKGVKAIEITNILNEVLQKVNKNPLRIEQKQLEADIKNLENNLKNAVDGFNAAMTLTGGKKTWVSSMLEAEIEKIQKLLESMGIKLNFKKTENDLKENLSKSIETAFTDAAEGLLEGIGNILGGDSASDVFGQLFGNLTTSLGKALIKFAVEAAKVKLVIDNLKDKLFGTGPIGWAAIAAATAIGIGLVASGKLLANKGFAKGGYVSGDGHGTSDSIPARLSNGEYVVKASSVQRYGVGFLDAINSGSFKKFADGGLVQWSRAIVNRFEAPSIPGLEPQKYKGIVNRPAMAGVGGGVVGETIIRGQDLKLVLSRADSRFNNTTSR